MPHLRIPILTALVLALVAACCCTSLPDSPVATRRPTRTRTSAPTKTPAEIVEIIAHVGMNTLTNIVGKASRVAIDFPSVELDLAA